MSGPTNLFPSPFLISESATLRGDAKQAHNQCRVVHALALSLARVSLAQAKILEQMPNAPTNLIGENTAEAMEWLGNHLANQDAMDDEHEWMDPIFHAGHERWPVSEIPEQFHQVPPTESFQSRVQTWLLACFGEMIAGDREERNHRFLEEAIELVQSKGCTASEAHQLVDYVFGRPVGEPSQEVGGVMVTLAALCGANGLDMHQAGETELERIWGKVEQIRAKQAAKPKHSPLPEAVAQTPAPRHADFSSRKVISDMTDPHIAYELIDKRTGNVHRTTVPGEPLVLDSFEERECFVQQILLCCKCGGRMRNGIAMGQTYTTGAPDFPGDTAGMTLSPGGPGRIVNVLKCEACGHSVSCC